MLISIIVPSYNVEKNIYVTLRSIINQDFDSNDFEILVIDDYSTDNTKKKVEEFIKKNPQYNFHLISHTYNRGVSAARNTGIRQSKGDYILFLDGDDYISDDYLKTVKEKTLQDSSDIIFYGFNKVTESGIVIENYFEKYSLPISNICGEDMFIKVNNKEIRMCTHSAIYKRHFLYENKLSFTEGCHSGEDTEFIYKALIMANEIGFINKVLSYYVKRLDSITNSYNIKRFESIKARERINNFVKEYGTKKEIAAYQYAMYDAIASVYLYNYNESLVILKMKYKTYSKAIMILNREIDNSYPNLRKYISTTFKKYPGNNFKTYIKMRLFNISPKIYNLISKFSKS